MLAHNHAVSVWQLYHILLTSFGFALLYNVGKLVVNIYVLAATVSATLCMRVMREKDTGVGRALTHASRFMRLVILHFLQLDA
jgi:hypothetical protein